MPGSVTPARRPSDRRAVVEYVYDVAHGLQETDWLEWKSRYDLTKGAGRAATAKQILGFANRTPDVAARNAGGYAYLLLGVEPGTYHGMPVHDPADVETWLRPYVGDKVLYDIDYVTAGGKNVLFITVDPAQWGDDIHSMRREGVDDEGKSIPLGTVFVRKPGKTDRATAIDVDRLTERARRQGATLALSVEVDASLPALPGNCLDDEFRDRYLAERQRALLAGLPAASVAPSILDGLVLSPNDERRSREEFEASVDDFVEATREAWSRFAIVEAVEQRKPALQFTLVNATDENYEAVQVDLTVPLPYGVVFKSAHEASERLEPPTEPLGWGMHTLSSLVAAIRPTQPDRRELGLSIEPDGARATVVRFAPLHARPRTRHSLGELIVAALPVVVAERVVATWRATSASTRGEVMGQVSFTVEPSPDVPGSVGA